MCENSLHKVAEELELGRYLKLGKGEDATGGRGRDSILSDALEAVIGAIYLDGGLEKAKREILAIRRQLVQDGKVSNHLGISFTVVDDTLATIIEELRNL